MKKETWEEMKKLENLIIDEGSEEIVPFSTARLIIRLLKSTAFFFIVARLIQMFGKATIDSYHIVVILGAIIFLGLLGSLENYMEKCVKSVANKVDEKLAELKRFAEQDLNLKEAESLKKYYQKNPNQ